jgi:hypothetical protein
VTSPRGAAASMTRTAPGSSGTSTWVSPTRRALRRGSGRRGR